MVVIIKNSGSPEKIRKELQAVQDEETKKRIERLNPFFGILKLKEYPVILQRRWRDE